MIDITRSIGLDVGDVRIGVALSDPLGILASPLTIITRGNGNADIEEILEIIRDSDVRQIIVGLPISINGTEGIQAEKTRAFAGELGRQTDIPIIYQDERLSTVEAKRMVREARKPGRTERYDAAAAALILQEYLNMENPVEFPDDEPLSL
ncbi:MAG: Holliday junction resolvase RuvX [Dehalococcoidales bacterium]|nr:Holliday junction resolvase RuvX [Dehalococcoidales bacterium]